MFLNAGRFSYIIEYPKGKYYFHKSIIHYRKEPLPIKQIQESDIHNETVNCEFVFDNSVFKTWKDEQDP